MGQVHRALDFPVIAKVVESIIVRVSHSRIPTRGPTRLLVHHVGFRPVRNGVIFEVLVLAFLITIWKRGQLL